MTEIDWLRTFAWVEISVGMIGNMCVLVIFFSNWTEMTVKKFLMCNLAFADFSMCLGLIFMAISLESRSMSGNLNVYYWQYGAYF